MIKPTIMRGSSVYFQFFTLQLLPLQILPTPAPDPQLIHLMITFRSQLDSGKSMDAVIDAGVHLHKASEHLRIGRIDDGIHSQPRDIPLSD